MTLSYSQGLLGIVLWPVLPRATLLPWVVQAGYAYLLGLREVAEGWVSTEMNMKPLKFQDEEGLGRDDWPLTGGQG